MLGRLKRWFGTKKSDMEPEQRLTEKPIVVLNDLSVFKTPDGQGRWTLVVGAEGQGKTYFVREIAKKVENFAYVDATEFQPTENVDLFIIDDLHKASKTVQQKIFEFLCGARHQNIKNIICVTQELKGIPSEVIRRFKVIAFFYSAKQHMKMQSIVKGGLREASEFANKIIRLMPRTFILYDVQSGFIKNSLPNTETALIMKSMHDVLPYKHQKPHANKTSKITLENGEKLNRENIKITPLIVKTLKEHPEYKYAYIAQKYQTTEPYVKKVASRWHRGLLKYT